MRWYARIVAVLLLLPGAVAAQDQSPIPDHWLTLESLSSLLSLTDAQRAGMSEPYAAINAALQRANARRDELKAAMSGSRRVSTMSESERQALAARLESVRTEYAGRQAELDQLLGALRAQLTPDQQARFDALEKPRVLPQGTKSTPTSP
jgi:LTXXQ motif family protein